MVSVLVDGRLDGVVLRLPTGMEDNPPGTAVVSPDASFRLVILYSDRKGNLAGIELQENLLVVLRLALHWPTTLRF